MNQLLFSAKKLSKASFLLLFLGFISFTTVIGCRKSLNTERSRINGIVFEDCTGKTAKNQKVILFQNVIGCFGGEYSTIDSTETDDEGKFTLKFKAIVDDNSTTCVDYSVKIGNAYFYIDEDIKNYAFYPFDNKMNAEVTFNFNRALAPNDTLYYQVYNLRNEIISTPQYLVAPQTGTTVKINNLKIAGNSNANMEWNHDAQLYWCIGKNGLNRSSVNPKGYFFLKHCNCSNLDRFEVPVNF